MIFSRKQNEYCVYVHTNKTNHKKYYGITRQAPERRWQNGHGYDGTYFGNAIAKYGWDGFSHDVIIRGISKERACKYEVALILLFKTNQRRHGYNISEGGQTCDAITNKRGEEHPNHKRVKMIDPETRQVIRVFGAQSEAARIMGISRKGITKACRGNGIATYKGFIWEYADGDYIKPGNPGSGNYDHANHFKPVVLIEPDGRKCVFESVLQAAEITGVKRSSISRYLCGIRKDRSGRRWCYGSDVFTEAERVHSQCEQPVEL